jgi:urease accessory protein
MHLVESIVGNERESVWKERLESAHVDHLRLDQWEAQKNRFRKMTEAGLEVAISLDRNTHLREGDILCWDESARRAVVAHIQLNDVMVIQIGELLRQSPELMLRTCVELGHALGNQHWPAVVKDQQVFVPLTVDRNVMAAVMRTHAFHDVEYKFIAGAEVIPYLAPNESRRLFGGADSTPHSHVHEHLRADGTREVHSHADGTGVDHRHRHS